MAQEFQGRIALLLHRASLLLLALAAPAAPASAQQVPDENGSALRA